MKLPALRIGAFLAKLAGGGAISIFALGGPRWTAIGGAVAAGAGLILDFLPAATVQADAPVVNASGKQIGTNVSTTSTLPIEAPTKGA